jgi:hypothetical protein
MPSSRAVRLSSNCPVAACAPASAISSLTRSEGRTLSGNRRRATANQRAALTGARWAAASPASRRTATAAMSPCLAEYSTW